MVGEKGRDRKDERRRREGGIERWSWRRSEERKKKYIERE